MANKKKTQDVDTGIPKESQIQHTEDQQEPSLKADSIAVGHVRLPDGTFQIISVEVDSKTMTAGKVTGLEKCRDIGEALYEFKIAAVNLGLV